MAKSHARVQAYGEVDELNCLLGLALAQVVDEPVRGTLTRAQKELFAIGAVMATAPGKKAPNTVPAAEKFEGEIDALTAELPELKTFILPGGSQSAAWLHAARAVCRRAERSAVALRGELPAGVIVYLNRLSDYLFTAARWVNHKQGRAETPWP